MPEMPFVTFARLFILMPTKPQSQKTIR